MDLPESWKFTKDHEWIAVASGDAANIGVTPYALEQLGDIVHIELPEVGESFSQGDSFGTIESTKTVSDLYMPVAGKIIDVNQDLVAAPEKLSGESLDEGWLVKIELDDSKSVSDLLSASDYAAFLAEQDDE